MLSDPGGASDNVGSMTIGFFEAASPPDPVAPSSLPFDAHLIGQDPVTETYTVTNDGDDSFTLNTVDGAGAPFQVSAPSNATITDTGSETVAVTFAPTARGSYSDNLTAKTDTGDDPVTTVAGDGVAPEARIAADGQSDISGDVTLAFGNVRAGTGAGDQTVTLSNIGDGRAAAQVFGDLDGDGSDDEDLRDLHAAITASGLQGLDFAGPSGTISLESGATVGDAANPAARDLTLSLADPLARGTLSGEIAIDLLNGSRDGTNGQDDQVTITATGAVVGPVASASDGGDLDFGVVALGDTAVREFTFGNTSSDTGIANEELVGLSLLDLELGGLGSEFYSLEVSAPGSAGFQAVGDDLSLLDIVLMPGDEATFRVLFSPDDAVTQRANPRAPLTADISLFTDLNDAFGTNDGTADFTVALTGRAAVPAPGAALLLLPGLALVFWSRVRSLTAA